MLPKTLAAWGSDQFEAVFKQEVSQLSPDALPLQRGLSQTSHVGSCGIEAVVLNTRETGDKIHIKAGIFYSGINAGSCCADDPTPVEEQPEYCELEFSIDKASGQVVVGSP